MSYIDRVELGGTVYNIKADGVVDPTDSSVTAAASDIASAVTTVGNGSLADNKTVTSLLGNSSIGASATVTGRLSSLDTPVTITLTSAGWTQASGVWVQSASVTGMTSDSTPIMVGMVYPASCTDAQRKAVQKSASFIVQMETGAGAATFTATQQPTTDVTLVLRGV